MSESNESRRVELPVLCKFLRCQSCYGASENNTAGQLVTSTPEAYWCLATMEAFGPDDSYAHATVCAGDRGCYRRRD